jgi:integrase
METAITILTALADTNNLTSDSKAHSLSAAKVRNAKASGKAVMLADGGGLLLAVSPAGSRVWRYRFRLGGQQTLTIGSYPEISLEQARTAHRAARWLVERGDAPLDYIEREQARLEAARLAAENNTVRKVLADWLTSTGSGLRQSTRKHRKAMVEQNLLPSLGDKKISAVTRKDLVVLLTTLDTEKPVTAKHLRGYIKQVFEYAINHELIQGSPLPPANILTKRKALPRKAMPLNKVGEFLKVLDSATESDPLTKLAMKLLVLTWSRTSEVVAARWAEVDLVAGTWTIPASRMKADEVHTIYLSNQAREVLVELKRHSWGREFLFPNRRRPDSHMSRMTLTSWRKRWGFSDAMDIHGFRSVGSTWANESGKYRPDVIEVALAHKESDRIRAAYNRAQFIGALRGLWQDWADTLDEKLAVAKADNVVVADFSKVA